MMHYNALASGFLLGLSTGPICIATCFPVVLPFAVSENAGDTAFRRWLFLGKFLVGRLLAYLTTGLIVGLVAHHLGLAGTRVGILAWMVLSLVLIAYGLGVNAKHLGFCRLVTKTVSSASFPFMLGVLTGLSVCPPLLLALTYVMERSSNMMFGIAFFFAFFCATTVFILPIGVLGHLPRKNWLEFVGRAAAVVSGIFFFSQAMFILLRTL